MSSTLSISFPTNSQDLLDTFRDSGPAKVSAWPISPAAGGGDSDSPLHDIVVGCTDGTLYVLHQQSRKRRFSATSLRPSISERADMFPLTKSSRHLGVGHRHRSASPSSTKSSSFSPMQLTRTRVVSGVSAEQVEAPKNYVDFDDEPDRLKGMLKGRGHRDKPTKPPPLPDVHSHLDDKVSLPETSSKIVVESRSSLRSPSSSPSTLSSPPSPGVFSTIVTDDDQTIPWTPALHIFPPWTRAGSVECILPVHHPRLFLCLYQRG